MAESDTHPKMEHLIISDDKDHVIPMQGGDSLPNVATMACQKPTQNGDAHLQVPNQQALHINMFGQMLQNQEKMTPAQFLPQLLQAEFLWSNCGQPIDHFANPEPMLQMQSQAQKMPPPVFPPPTLP